MIGQSLERSPEQQGYLHQIDTFLYLASHAEERPWWPIQSLNKGQKAKDDSEGLRGKGDQIKFVDLRFHIWQVVGLSELC